jgi:hypothetical protein
VLTYPEIYQLYNNNFYTLDICGGFLANGSSVIYESTGSIATADSGSLTLLHGNAGGSSSIMFKSVNDPLEYGYIQYEENTAGSTGYHYGLMTIGIENDSGAGAYTAQADRVSLFPSGGQGFVGVNTKTPYYSLDVSGNFRVNNSVAINKDISSQYALDAKSAGLDIITWTQDPRVFIAEALNPATIEKVGIDDEKKSALVVVADSQLSLAIGKNGQKDARWG